MTYQWVLFDADETLFHFDNFSGLKHLFAQYDVVFGQTEFDQYQSLNKPLWVAYQEGKITAEQLQTRRFEYWSNRLNVDAKRLNEQFLDAMAQICTTLPGAVELVQFLHDKHIKMGIITNGFARLQQIRLERTGFLPYFSPVVISELVGVAKPHPRIFEKALEQMGYPDKKNILMVGDTLESDIRGGNEAGLDTCWLNHHRNQHQTSDIKPTYEIHSLFELPQLLTDG